MEITFNTDDIKAKGLDEHGYIIWESEEERDERLGLEWEYLRRIEEEMYYNSEEFTLGRRDFRGD